MIKHFRQGFVDTDVTEASAEIMNPFIRIFWTEATADFSLLEW